MKATPIGKSGEDTFATFDKEDEPTMIDEFGEPMDSHDDGYFHRG